MRGLGLCNLRLLRLLGLEAGRSVARRGELFPTQRGHLKRCDKSIRLGRPTQNPPVRDLLGESNYLLMLNAGRREHGRFLLQFQCGKTICRGWPGMRSGSEAEIVREAGRLYAEAASLIGAGRAVEEFFFAETEFYVARNSAAQFQFTRQQTLGIGWANHDHHTYRSTREGFQALMGLWQRMGFSFRERFYAGADAGWGAQVLEHPISRVILFCDVDMSPAELDIDFLTVPLPARDSYGTIGLWCALHGSSIADAECTISNASSTLHPASRIQSRRFRCHEAIYRPAMLKQAFTAAQLWIVGSGALPSSSAKARSPKRRHRPSPEKARPAAISKSCSAGTASRGSTRRGSVRLFVRPMRGW